MFRGVEHEKSFITSGPDLSTPSPLHKIAKGLNICYRLPLHQYLLYGSSECMQVCTHADVNKGLNL